MLPGRVTHYLLQAAQDAIRSATTEAKCNVPNGIGVVKVRTRALAIPIDVDYFKSRDKRDLAHTG